eukprot:1194262-Prorocentrum_minimum.AAC.7
MPPGGARSTHLQPHERQVAQAALRGAGQRRGDLRAASCSTRPQRRRVRPRRRRRDAQQLQPGGNILRNILDYFGNFVWNIFWEYFWNTFGRRRCDAQRLRRPGAHFGTFRNLSTGRRGVEEGSKGVERGTSSRSISRHDMVLCHAYVSYLPSPGRWRRCARWRPPPADEQTPSKASRGRCRKGPAPPPPPAPPLFDPLWRGPPPAAPGLSAQPQRAVNAPSYDNATEVQYHTTVSVPLERCSERPTEGRHQLTYYGLRVSGGVPVFADNTASLT